MLDLQFRQFAPPTSAPHDKQEYLSFVTSLW